MQILDKYTPIMKNTSQEYDTVVAICRSLFVNKMTDYGSAWRIYVYLHLQIKFTLSATNS
jgi:hypothetical protein